MGNFWAKFKTINGQQFRFDTRIYLDDIDHPSDNDTCIGAIVGKNPGSAKSSGIEVNDLLTKINHDGDKLLPTVRNIIIKSINCKDGNQYVQVLNLFYLCNNKLNQAISYNREIEPLVICPSENKYFPWVWFVWGGGNIGLNIFKERYVNINSHRKFFYNKNLKEVIERMPTNTELAKHTQGLRHDDIVPFLKMLLNGN